MKNLKMYQKLFWITNKYFAIPREKRFCEKCWRNEKNFTHCKKCWIEVKDHIFIDQIEELFVWSFTEDYSWEKEWNYCPVDFSKEENKGKSWNWSNSSWYRIFLTKEEAEAEYEKRPESMRIKEDIYSEFIQPIPSK